MPGGGAPVFKETDGQGTVGLTFASDTKTVTRQFASTGAFLSVDPLLDARDPSQWNGYAYAGGNPVSQADPSGARPKCLDEGSCTTTSNGHGGTVSHAPARPPAQRRHYPTQQQIVRNPSLNKPRMLSGDYVYPPSHPRYAPPASRSPKPKHKGSSVLGVIGSTAKATGHFLNKHKVAIAIGVLTVVNVAQLGMDPFTDSAEGGLIAGEAVGEAASEAAPGIKLGAEGGETAGKAFSQKVRQEVLNENPSTCVYCRMETDRPQVDHVIPRSRGGNATLENGQTTCGWCNSLKGARDFPVNPPAGYEGMWPPAWWGP